MSRHDPLVTLRQLNRVVLDNRGDAHGWMLRQGPASRKFATSRAEFDTGAWKQ